MSFEVADSAPVPADEPAPAPITLREAWALWAAVGIAVLFVLACVGNAFDVPGLRHALDARRLFR